MGMEQSGVQEPQATGHRLWKRKYGLSFLVRKLGLKLSTATYQPCDIE